MCLIRHLFFFNLQIDLCFCQIFRRNATYSILMLFLFNILEIIKENPHELMEGKPCSNGYELVIPPNGPAECKHKCEKNAGYCGEHGTCFYDYSQQNIACR